MEYFDEYEERGLDRAPVVKRVLFGELDLSRDLCNADAVNIGYMYGLRVLEDNGEFWIDRKVYDVATKEDVEAYLREQDEMYDYEE